MYAIPKMVISNAQKTGWIQAIFRNLRCVSEEHATWVDGSSRKRLNFDVFIPAGFFRTFETRMF